jgi:hypothetical protein
MQILYNVLILRNVNEIFFQIQEPCILFRYLHFSLHKMALFYLKEYFTIYSIYSILIVAKLVN